MLGAQHADYIIQDKWVKSALYSDNGDENKSWPPKNGRNLDKGDEVV